MGQRGPVTAAPRPQVSGARAVRTFVAVPVDEPVRTGVARWQARLAPAAGGIKWVEPHNLHITLAFLGDLARDEVEEAIAAVTRACAGHRPFTLGFGGFGVFPHWRAPRVLWVGMGEGAAELTALAGAVARHLRAAGFAMEDRPYRPHLTVGRWRDPRGAAPVRAAVAAEPSGLPPCRVQRVDIMASQLTPHGPIYTCLGYVPLGEPGAPGDTRRGEG